MAISCYTLYQLKSKTKSELSIYILGQLAACWPAIYFLRSNLVRSGRQMGLKCLDDESAFVSDHAEKKPRLRFVRGYIFNSWFFNLHLFSADFQVPLRFPSERTVSDRILHSACTFRLGGELFLYNCQWPGQLLSIADANPNIQVVLSEE